MSGAHVGRNAVGDPCGPAAKLDGFAGALDGALRIFQRHKRHAQQAGVYRAEVGNAAVVRRRAPIGQIDIAACVELRVRKGGEDELAGEAQLVEGAHPFVGIHGAVGEITLRTAHDIGCQLRRLLRIVAARPALLHEFERRSIAAAGQAQIPELAGRRSVCIARQPVHRFHEVAVGVVNKPLTCIRRHGSPWVAGTDGQPPWRRRWPL